MSEKRAGQVITFYSYKGGVGRSMAVANVATLLAQRGKKVLVLDFDFEAPGLHRYFFNKPSGFNRRLESDGPRLGLIEFFCTLRDRLQERLPQGFPVRGAGHPLSSEQASTFLMEIARELVRSGEFGYEVRLRNPNVPSKAPQRVATLRFMPVGRTREGNLDAGYVTAAHAFDWRDFYSKYKEVFPVLSEAWGEKYDYVLIDSRTGLTDIGSICTQLLPEKLVLVFSPNQQSLHGALEVGRQAVKQRQASEDLRPLPLFPLISRVEDSEELAKRDWINKAQEQFQSLFHEIYDLEECELEEYFSLARIPHRSFYAYGERIAAEEQPTQETGALAQAYGQFIECLDFENPNEVRDVGARKLAQQENELLEKLSDEASLKELSEQRQGDVRVRLLYAQGLVMRGSFQEAIDVCTEIVDRFGLSRDINVRVHVAQALAQKLSCCWQLGLYAQTISVIDELIQRFGEAPETALREMVSQALVNKGVILGQLELKAEALSTYDEVLRRFGDAPETALRGQVAKALFNKGVVLGQLERGPEELSTYEDVVRRLGEVREMALRELLAKTLVNKGVVLGRLERRQEALSTYEEVVRRFGNAPETVLREQVAKALVNKGGVLRRLERQTEALSTYEDVLRLFEDAREGVLRELVAKALVNKGDVLGWLERREEQLSTYEEVVRRFGNAPETVLRELVAQALVNKAVVLEQLDRRGEELSTYEEVVRRFGDAPETALRELVAQALFNKGVVQGRLERREEALSTYEEVVRRFGNAPETTLRELAAKALLNKGVAQGRLERREEALSTYEEVVRRFGNAPETTLRELAAKALLNKGGVLRRLERVAEALSTYEEVVQRFENSEEALLSTQVANALNRVGFLLLCEAKRLWGAQEVLTLLEKAHEKVQASLERRPDQPFALGNAGYIAFLQGRRDEARSLLAEAIKLGGEELRKAELDDADIHSIPEDEEFRALVRSL